MSASEEQRAEWLDPELWDRLTRLEGHHQQLQTAHQNARRRLEQVSGKEAPEMLRAWQQYCDVIAELDRATAEFEALRTALG
jgi:hypothetical protein